MRNVWLFQLVKILQMDCVSLHFLLLQEKMQTFVIKMKRTRRVKILILMKQMKEHVLYYHGDIINGLMVLVKDVMELRIIIRCSYRYFY